MTTQPRQMMTTSEPRAQVVVPPAADIALVLCVPIFRPAVAVVRFEFVAARHPSIVFELECKGARFIARGGKA